MSEGPARKSAGRDVASPLLDPPSDMYRAVSISMICGRAIQRQQSQNRPGHVSIVAADLVAILHPHILLGVPPPRQLDGARTDRSCEVSVAQTPVMPISVALKGGKDGITDLRVILGLVASHQGNRGDGVVVEKRGPLQGARLYGGKAGKKLRSRRLSFHVTGKI